MTYTGVSRYRLKKILLSFVNMNTSIISRLATISVCFLAGALFQLSATVKTGSIFSDNMLLQQNATVRFHGTAAPHSPVTVATQWSHDKLKTKADDNGVWEVNLPTPSYGGPYTIMISDRDGTLTLHDVMIGDVWVCAGQSNMEMPVKGYPGQFARGGASHINHARPDRTIRLYHQPVAISTTPVDTIPSTSWTKTTPATVAEFSMIGYTFGDFLNGYLDIPVGLIHCNWETTNIQAWMSRPTLENKFPEVKLPALNDSVFELANIVPTLTYNAMVNPWKGFPVKGVIWYQGESNTTEPDRYKKLFPAMVNDWKQIFITDPLPFYYVQLAPYRAENPKGTLMAGLRKAQSEILYEMPDVGMITIGDYGDSLFIHPPYKVPVGERLACLALQKSYGIDGLRAEPPVAHRATVSPADPCKIIVEWDFIPDGLAPLYTRLGEFEVVDSDGNIYPAYGEVFYPDNSTVTVTGPIENPVEVRYGYHNLYRSSLFSNSGLPASPFLLKVQ